MPKELAELQKENLPRFDWRTLLKVEGELHTVEVQELDNYFRQFVGPAPAAIIGDACVCCGAQLGGLIGSFQYGVAHGEGHCSRCKYPARAKHYNVGPIERLTLILQYHPDELRIVKNEQGDDDE